MRSQYLTDNGKTYTFMEETEGDKVRVAKWDEGVGESQKGEIGMLNGVRIKLAPKKKKKGGV